MSKLTTGDLGRIMDILASIYNKRDIAKPQTPKEIEMLDLLNRLQEYIYNKEV